MSISGGQPSPSIQNAGHEPRVAGVSEARLEVAVELGEATARAHDGARPLLAAGRGLAGGGDGRNAVGDAHLRQVAQELRLVAEPAAPLAVVGEGTQAVLEFGGEHQLRTRIGRRGRRRGRHRRGGHRRGGHRRGRNRRRRGGGFRHRPLRWARRRLLSRGWRRRRRRRLRRWRRIWRAGRHDRDADGRDPLPVSGHRATARPAGEDLGGEDVRSPAWRCGGPTVS